MLNHQAFYKKRYDALQNKTWKKQLYPLDEICYENVQLLNKLVEATACKIVVSSTWRMGRPVESLQSILNQSGFIGEVIDTTPVFAHGLKSNDEKITQYTIPRGCEIEFWLKSKKFQRINWSKEKQLEYLEKSEVKNFVILDDDSDFLYNQREHFVKCNAYKQGFNGDCLEKAIAILNMDLTQLYYQDI